ncbi:hypothetical protein CRG98_049352, partial [Punica granatum]
MGRKRNGCHLLGVGLVYATDDAGIEYFAAHCKIAVQLFDRVMVIYAPSEIASSTAVLAKEEGICVGEDRA